MMDKQTRIRLIEKLTQLKLMSKMYEYTFKNAADKMDAKTMDKLLDAKLEADRQIKLLEKILEDAR